MNAKPLLDYVARYVQLTADEEKILCEAVALRKYLKNQFVVQHGEVCRHESFVLKGCLKTFYVDTEGQEHVVSFAIENWWTADLGSFITQTPAEYNVQCLEPCELLQFSHENLEVLYQRVPKMERFFRIILQNAFVASQKRIVWNFSLPARDRYLKFRQQYPSIDQRVSQYLIASYLGITKEFLSKIRSQLVHES